MIAIDVPNGLYYEGHAMVGYPLWPAPIITLATVVRSPADYEHVPTNTDLFSAALLFREDFFDPVTRIRRGRFYNRAKDGPQPHNWRVLAHPAIPHDRRSENKDGHLHKQLCGFHDWSARSHVGATGDSVTLVLGVQAAMTLWQLVGIEQISSGEDLVTLKARSNLGVLPEILGKQIPEVARRIILESVDKLLDTAYRAGPESVIDRCRDLCGAALGAYFEQTQPGSAAKDLGALSKLAANGKLYVAQNAAQLVGLLHARAKPSEQNRCNLNSLRESDAALALECAGVILRELGWAR